MFVEPKSHLANYLLGACSDTFPAGFAFTLIELDIFSFLSHITQLDNRSTNLIKHPAFWSMVVDNAYTL